MTTRPASLLAGILLALILSVPPSSSAQVTLLSSFDPQGLGELCSIAVDPQEGVVFLYGCFNDDIYRFSYDGALLGTVPRPGESSNDVDLQIAPEDLSIRGTSVPRGTLLFINGDLGPAEIYAVDPGTGTVLDTLFTDFGRNSVVGGAYSPFRDTFFLVNFSNNVIGEFDPLTGLTLNTFDVSEHVNVFYGDLEVSPTNGNLFIVTNADEGIYELTPDGTFEGHFPVPGGVGNLTGIGLDCERNEAWVSERSGFFRRLGQVECGGSTPVVTVTEPQDVVAVANGDVPLQATLPSGFNSTVHEVCYRRTGETEYSCTQLQLDGTGYQGAIPASFVTARGIQYYYRFSDGTTEMTVPGTDPENSAFVLPVRVDNLRAGGAFSPGTYRMVSMPVDLLDRSFLSVLDEYGPADSRRWRLLRWEPTLEAYQEYPNLTGGFDPCEAYWLITFDGGDFEVDNGQSVDPLEPCAMTIRPGWNQFGSPYAFPVAWSDVDVSGTIDGPVLYDASTGDSGGDADPYVYDVQILEPWQGYWVFNPGSQDIFMSFNPVEAFGKSDKKGDDRRLSGDEYELRLRASLPGRGLVDSQNHVGFSTRASDGFDKLDFAEAPPVGDYVRLSIVEEDMRFAGSFRPAGDGQAWDLRIDGRFEGRPARGIVRMTLDEFGRRPGGFNLRVVDLDEGLPVRIDDDSFEVTLTPSQPVRNLRLIVGTGAYSKEAGGSILEVPERADLAQNYPNPFNPSTRIRYQVHVDGPVEIAVFDPLGRRVRTLVEADREPGWYETTWNGRDSSGAQASSGLYFYVLRTIDGSMARTMVLLR